MSSKFLVSIKTQNGGSGRAVCTLDRGGHPTEADILDWERRMSDEKPENGKVLITWFQFVKNDPE